MSRLELIGVLLVVAVCLAVVAWMIWRLLRPSRVPERLVEWKTPSEADDGHQADAYAALLGVPVEVDRPVDQVMMAETDNPELRGLANVTRTRIPRRPIMANYVSGAFAFPPPRRGFPYDQERERG